MGAMVTTSAPVTQPKNTKQDLLDAARRLTDETSAGHALHELGLALAAEIERQLAFDTARAVGNAGGAQAAPATTTVMAPSSASSTPAGPAAVGGATHDGGSTH